MVGQKKLLEQLDKYTIDSFPRSTLIIGEKGCGKHMITKYISDVIINLPLIDITELLSDEYIDQIHRNPNPSIYLIDLTIITEKAQNTILKFVEEPPANAFIIILAEYRNLVLNTVLNRCIIFEFERYSSEELKTFMDSDTHADIIISILRTPGKIKTTNLKVFDEAKELALKMIHKVDQASYANTLSISNKINYKDEYDKVDIDTFFDLLCFLMLDEYKKSNNKKILSMYKLTGEHRKSLLDKRINKKLLFENYLSDLWMLARSNS